MDQFTKVKAAIAAAVVIVFSFLAFIVFLLFKTTSDTVKNDKSAIPQKVNFISQNSQAQWNNYESNNFKISYPPEWNTGTYPISGGGNLIYFRNKGEGIESYPRINIQVTPIQSDSPTIQESVNNLLLLGLKHQDEITFHGIRATRISGEFALTFTPNDPSSKRQVSNTFLFFTKNGFMYSVESAYLIGDGKEDESKNIIDQILNTLEI